MKFYNIKDEYINYLKKYESKVADNKKGKRPYVGVVLEIDGIKYYTPFTSPKEKHRKMKNTKDFRKINQGIYGAINFNNMIPVVESALVLIDIDELEDENEDLKYKIDDLESEIEALKFINGSSLNDEYKREFINQYYNEFTPWELEHILKNGRQFLNENPLP